MKKLIVCTITVVLILTSINYSSVLAKKEVGDERKIVVFKKDFCDTVLKENIIKRVSATKLKNLDLINGMSIQISTEYIKDLEQQPEVLRIDDDAVVNIDGKPSIAGAATTMEQPQTLPWGIDTIDAENVFSNITADTIKIGIIDTGIDLSHLDLKDNIKGGYNAINPKNTYTDDNGHGTHVAGIVAGLNNSIGIVGVAPKADLYSIKALDSQGTGYVSDIIESINWAIKNKIQVLNMSFNISNDIQSLHDVVIKANNAGILQVASAGNNNGRPVTYPAAYNEIISVSATDFNNNVATFSAAGKVDISAPGVDIYSTYIGNSYQYMSGTSMAAPHVTGAVALLLSQPLKCDLNGDGKCSPSEVLKRLSESSIDIGPEGTDIYSGSGLINAYNAIYN